MIALYYYYFCNQLNVYSTSHSHRYILQLKLCTTFFCLVNFFSLPASQLLYSGYDFIKKSATKYFNKNDYLV